MLAVVLKQSVRGRIFTSAKCNTFPFSFYSSIMTFVSVAVRMTSSLNKSGFFEVINLNIKHGLLSKAVQPYEDVLL